MVSPRHPLALSFLLAASGIFAGCGPDSQAAPDSGVDAVDAGAQVDAAISADATPTVAELDALLEDLRNDRDATLLAQSRAQGWPAPVEGGYLFVSAGSETLLAGDHEDWQGVAMNAEDDFHWLVVAVNAGNRYKFTDGGSSWVADPWSRSYQWDNEGEMSMVTPTGSHLERHFQVGDANISERQLRLWIPEAAATHVLYAHDGQNLFNPSAFFGGWKLNDSAPAALMIVGIDNSGARMSEYTHTPDNIGGGATGGTGDDYAAYVQVTVRALVEQHYGEPATVGTIGSSLGGLISLHIADRYPGEYAFAASLSGTLGWGSIGSTGTDTMIARYLSAGHRSTAIYIDSGGNGGTCADSDGDGTNDDDDSSFDNYCETRQMETALVGLGYTYDADLWHWWETDAPHNEAAWSARVFRPLQNFMSL
jgi:predicted alpha/beta superfamily hydrolase